MGFGVWGLGFGVSGFGVWGLGFRGKVLRFGVWGSGFRILDSGFRGRGVSILGLGLQEGFTV